MIVNAKKRLSAGYGDFYAASMRHFKYTVRDVASDYEIILISEDIDIDRETADYIFACENNKNIRAKCSFKKNRWTFGGINFPSRIKTMDEFKKMPKEMEQLYDFLEMIMDLVIDPEAAEWDDPGPEVLP